MVEKTVGARRILPHEGHLHFVGIGGEGMCALASLAKDLGYTVSGCDAVKRQTFSALQARGIEVVCGHSTAHLPHVSALVYSLAAEGAEEVRVAAEYGIPTLSRPELLGELMRRYPVRVGVSGTHGKSTTTALLDAILRLGGKRPTTVSGAKLTHGENYTRGDASLFLYEACEYKDAFLSFSPSVSILLNLEYDHTDYFHSFSDMKASFLRSTLGAEWVVYNQDDKALAALFASDARGISVGTGEGCRYRYRTLSTSFGYSTLAMRFRGREIAFTVGAAGRHNATNAALAFAAADLLGAPIDTTVHAIECFHGIARRLEPIGELEGRAVYYDYAHHPTEIVVGIETLRAMREGEITLVFCPHTYTRTRDLFGAFARALSLAERVILMPIYAAREEPIEGISSEGLARAVGPQAIAVGSAEECYTLLCGGVGTILLMGAGDLSDVRARLGF